MQSLTNRGRVEIFWAEKITQGQMVKWVFYMSDGLNSILKGDYTLGG